MDNLPTGSANNLITIGRREFVSFPELNIVNIEAKIDTGAYRSALHCHAIEVLTLKGRRVLRCRLLDPRHPDYNEKELKFKVFKEALVKNSFGQVEERFAVKMAITIGNLSFKTEFTLTNRSEMKYPVLLGRKFLKKKFMVDVSQLYLLGGDKVAGE